MALEEEARRVDNGEKEAKVVEEKLVVPKKGKKMDMMRKALALRKALRAKKAKAELVPKLVVEPEPEPVPEPEVMEPENKPEPIEPENEPEPELKLEQDELGFVPRIEEEADIPLAIHKDLEPEPEEQHKHNNSIASTGTMVIKG